MSVTVKVNELLATAVTVISLPVRVAVTEVLKFELIKAVIEAALEVGFEVVGVIVRLALVPLTVTVIVSETAAVPEKVINS